MKNSSNSQNSGSAKSKFFTTKSIVLVLLFLVIAVFGVLWAKKHAQTTSVDNVKTCDNSPLKAVYKVTEFEDGKQVSYPLILLRNERVVVYEYPEARLADVWRLEMKDQLGMSRYFYENKRAIDYDSADLKNIGDNNKWRKLYHLVDVSNDQPESVKDDGCMTTQIFDNEFRKVVYLPQYGVAQEIYIYDDNKNTNSAHKRTYVLEDINVSDEIAKKLAEYQNYDAIDFADIGDNEADPFISKMINMGFIEHEEHSHTGDHDHH